MVVDTQEQACPGHAFAADQPDLHIRVPITGVSQKMTPLSGK